MQSDKLPKDSVLLQTEIVKHILKGDIMLDTFSAKVQTVRNNRDPDCINIGLMCLLKQAVQIIFSAMIHSVKVHLTISLSLFVS